MAHEFSIYTPKKESLLTDINLKPLAFLGFVFCLFILNELIDLPEEVKYRPILLNGLWITIAIVGIYYYSLIRMDGDLSSDELEKKLKFQKEYIVINNEIIDLNDIQKITIHAFDSKRNQRPFVMRQNKSSYSLGVSNFLEIKLFSGQNINVQFQKTTEKELLKVKDELIHYYQNEKISLLNVTEALHIIKYEDIQQFLEEYPIKRINL
ncbi:hypothetical protein [Faecalibacter bovis]|uniref:Uncharacterized protein n=1 Tax=Faecalibacter bovis TaxID=2898187 RepID=A0ABX7XCS2_9FLAO|nr:hypothetical protein [Faecalibacter bovis]QTV05701.1 hypothetical protein J9309_13190 [Faecalibacter bovis]